MTQNKLNILIADDEKLVEINNSLASICECDTSTISEYLNCNLILRDYWSDAYCDIDGPYLTNPIHIAWIDFMFISSTENKLFTPDFARGTDKRGGNSLCNGQGLLLLLKLRTKYGAHWPFYLFTTQEEFVKSYSYDSEILFMHFDKVNDIIRISSSGYKKCFEDLFPSLIRKARRCILRNEWKNYAQYSCKAQTDVLRLILAINQGTNLQEIKNVIQKTEQIFAETLKDLNWPLGNLYPLEYARLKAITENKDSGKLGDRSEKAKGLLLELIGDIRPILGTFTHQCKMGKCLYHHKSMRPVNWENQRQNIASVIDQSCHRKEDSTCMLLSKEFLDDGSDNTDGKCDLAYLFSGRSWSLTELWKADGYTVTESGNVIEMKKNNARSPSIKCIVIIELFSPVKCNMIYCNIKELYQIWLNNKCPKKENRDECTLHDDGTPEDLLTEMLGHWGDCANGASENNQTQGSTEKIVRMGWNWKYSGENDYPIEVTVYICDAGEGVKEWYLVCNRAQEASGGLFGHIVPRSRTWCSELLWYSKAKGSEDITCFDAYKMATPSKIFTKPNEMGQEIWEHFAGVDKHGSCFAFKFVCPPEDQVINP